MDPISISLTAKILFFAVAVAFCALFSFLETSITALRLFNLKELAQTTSNYQKLFQALEKNPTHLLTTILIAGNLADVTAVTFGNLAMEELFQSLPASIGFFLSIFITTAILLVCEIIPKNAAKAYGERLFGSTLWVTNLTFYALYPLVMVVNRGINFVVYQISKENPEDAEFVTSEKEIQFLIDYITDKGLIEPAKTSMLKSVFELGTTPVRNIMVPATSMVALNADLTLKQAQPILERHQFSRFPVFNDSIDNIIGMLHLKDVFSLYLKDNSALQDKPLRTMLRPILFIPDSLKVNALLERFKKERVHIAVVMNEYGGVIGLVTLEDVLEEIVGEIRDEYESVKEKIVALKQGGWLADASIELDQLSEFLKTPFETDHALTLGGFLTERLQRVPKKSEYLVYRNFIFQVQQANQKRVFQVLILPDQGQEVTTELYKEPPHL